MKLISIATFALLSSSLALACGSPSEAGGTGESSSGSTSSDGSMTAGSATLPTTTMTSMTASATTDATATDATTDATTTQGVTTAVDSSGDATAGSTDTGSGSTGGSSSGGSTGGDPGAYGPCEFSKGGVPVCPDGEQCAVLPEGQHWCGLPCDQDPDPCPEASSGDAVVECSGFYMQCALNCADNPTCPDGMECVFIMDGLSRCGWPAPA